MAADSDSIAGPVVALLILGGSTIFGFGYAVAVNQRANADYKKTKEGLPGMRKAFWTSWWAAVKIGFWILLGGAFLIFWMINDTSGR